MSDPFEHADYDEIRWLYHKTGRSQVLTSLIILAVGAAGLVGSILFMGLILKLTGQ